MFFISAYFFFQKIDDSRDGVVVLFENEMAALRIGLDDGVRKVFLPAFEEAVREAEILFAPADEHGLFADERQMFLYEPEIVVAWMGRFCGDVLRKTLDGDARFVGVVGVAETGDGVLRQRFDGAGFEGFFQQQIPRTDKERAEEWQSRQIDGTRKMAGHPDDGIHDDDFADFIWMTDGVEEADGAAPVMDN